ncbi:MAG: sugar phosphate isomerase/epimerase [Puniceicoccales bacterium]|jgi:sugar phosphate isomerase/epimerase|nr:sugar phosphate isomerase/epimerase [Puniceicoccales bacterium]
MNRLSFDQLAVCSWSLKPESPQQLVAQLREIPLARVQLALDPLLDKPAWAEARGMFADAGVSVVSGMIETGAEDYSTPASIRATGGLLPDAPFERLLARAPRHADLLDAFGLDKVSFHAGFIPHIPNAPKRKIIKERLAALAGVFAARGKLLLLETGQETARTLAAFLDEVALPNVRVNFDPGNMLLYSMGDPVAALELLLPRIAQIHIKDAVPSGDIERWGVEQPAGEGSVDWERFFAVLAGADYAGDLVIERECGSAPIPEIARAAAFLGKFLG